MAERSSGSKEARSPKRPPSPGKKPEQRADAQRNRARLLDVARAVFAEQGVGAPIDAIAQRAEVGVGTLYRHFPTKDALIVAIVEEHLVRTVENARALARAPDPGAALFSFLEQLWLEGARKKDLVGALSEGGSELRSRIAGPSADLRRALSTLLRRAQEAGAVRPKLHVEELLALFAGTLSAASRSGVSPARLFEVLCDGLRPPGTAR